MIDRKEVVNHTEADIQAVLSNMYENDLPFRQAVETIEQEILCANKFGIKEVSFEIKTNTLYQSTAYPTVAWYRNRHFNAEIDGTFLVISW